ncbi:MAG: hypothetical protein GWP08_16010 [Nitrospiraceae bacterium]|nr:hypothetical protein [Nitrospiraceae bacterium]
MSLSVRCMLTTVVVSLFVLAGCDGGGLFFSDAHTPSDGGDQGGGGNSDELNPDPIPDTQRNLGTWIVSYGDDWIAPSARNGAIEYAAKVSLRRNGTSLSGTGTVYRVFNEGSTAYDDLDIKVTGSITGDDAIASVTSTSLTNVYDAPTWYLRFAETQMVGMYVSFDFNENVVRAGHGIWQKVYSTDLTNTWVTAFSDADGTTAFEARPRTGLLVLDYDSEAGSLTGVGNYIEQRAGDSALDVEFNLTQGAVDGPRAAYTFEELSLADKPVDWFSFYTIGIMLGAYAQFDADGQLVRYGHATWYDAPDAGPEAVEYTWVTSFSDSDAGRYGSVSDYLMVLDLDAGSDNSVTGSGEYLESTEIRGSFRSVVVQNASIVGSGLQMTTRVNNGEYFVWDLRVAANIMAGSYQHFSATGLFLTRGTAEWRRDTAANPTPVGTWAASYFDTHSLATQGKRTQFALVNVSREDVDGSLSGTGALRYGNDESGRRLFDLRQSSVEAKDIWWRWRGADLFGDTVWRLRQAGGRLYGIYENENSAGSLESSGAAVWLKTPTTEVF